MVLLWSHKKYPHNSLEILNNPKILKFKHLSVHKKLPKKVFRPYYIKGITDTSLKKEHEKIASTFILATKIINFGLM